MADSLPGGEMDGTEATGDNLTAGGFGRRAREKKKANPEGDSIKKKKLE